MLIKNYNTFDFTHKIIFKILMRDNLGGGGLCICTLLRPPLMEKSYTIIESKGYSAAS